ncbi:MAG: DNA repair protein [Bacteroidetes bacterium]|nr:DNA repair protein [Bacteroidota bacterium]
MKLTIPAPRIFDFNECLWFLDRGYDECLHTISDKKVRKVFNADNQNVLVEISSENEFLICEILNTQTADLENIKKQIIEWFDLERDLSLFYTLLSRDEDLSFFTEKYFGLRLITIPNLFEALCWSIIGQQINLTFAYKIKRALVEYCGEFVEYEGNKYYLFPSPKDILKIDDEVFREMKFSRQKIAYIRNISEAFLQNIISKEAIQKIDNHKDRLAFLTKIKGVGEWTAQYALMKSLPAMEAVAYGDAGLNQALFNLKNIPKKDSRQLQEQIIEKYKGWEAYLVFYLWRSLSVKPQS